jgi:PAP2 superfamily
MPHWEMPWQLATVLAGSLFAAAGLAWLSGRRWLCAAVPFVREAGLVVALYAMWQYAGTFSVMGTEGALPRARWIWHTERVLHLPSEAAVQHLILHFPLLVETFNLYYATMHFVGLIIFLLWLFARHREHYSQIRITLVLLTGACLAIQLIPVAPPRLLGGLGLIDTANVYGQSVYALGGGMADQLSAMPSVHVAWAMLIAVGVWRATSSRWRWLAVGHAAATWAVVIATANHFWLDGIAAVILLLLAWPAAGVVRAALSAATARAAAVRRRDLAPAESPPDRLATSADVRSLGVR